MIFPTPKPPSQQLRRKGSLKLYYNHETRDTMTALHLFCKSGCSRYGRDIKAIVEIQPELVSHPTPNGGDTPLHFSVAAHDLDTTCLLLDAHPAAANIKSRKNGHFGSRMIPLHVALSSNASLEIVDALVKVSPRSVKQRDGHGQTPHQLAAQYYDERKLDQILACLDAALNNQHRGELSRPKKKCSPMIR